ncbi:MAG: oligosaccharide flippase family protein [Gemmatimonadaceae bacterium]
MNELQETSAPLGYLARIRGLVRRDFVRSVFVLAFGTLLGNGLSALVSPILTRLYAPGDLGRAGVFTAFINVASTASALRYELAIVSADTAEDAATLALGSLVIALPVSILLGGVLYGLITMKLFGFEVLPLWAAAVAPLSLFVASSFLTFRFWLLRDGKFASVSRIFVGQNITRAGVQLGSGVGHVGWTGLFLGDLSGRTLAVAVMAKRGWADLVACARRINRTEFKRVFALHREFPTVSLPSTLLDMVALNLPLPLVARYFGVDAGGQFALVQMVFALPASLIGGSIGDAFHSKAAELARTDRDQVRPFFLRTTRLLFLLGVGPFLFLALVGPTLVRLVFGARWETAGILAAVMTPWALGQLVVSPVSRIVFIVQGQRVKLLNDAFNLSIVAASFFVASHLHLSLIRTLGVLTAAQCVMYIVYFLLLLRTISKFTARAAAAGPIV